MPFSDTTNLTGGIQLCETLCMLGNGGISGDATLLKQFTNLINTIGISAIEPRLLSYTDYIRWDDINHTDQPIATFNIVSGQSDYQVKVDSTSLDIYNITRVRFLSSATETKYTDLERMTIDDDKAPNAMSPNADEVGIPTTFLERNNTIYLYVQPNYTVAKGVKIFFERQASYFISTDTTKKFGVPKPFQTIPFLYACRMWLSINKPENGVLISVVNNSIAKAENDLDTMITKRNPVRIRMTMETVDTR